MEKTKTPEFISFKELGDERGKLVVIEENKDVPFDIRRVFYIYGADGNVVRGQHANRKSEFIIVNVAGSAKVKTFDGNEEKIFNIAKPHTGVYIPRMVWKDMYDFSADSVMLVIASEVYDESEYIRSMEEYMAERAAAGDI